MLRIAFLTNIFIFGFIGTISVLNEKLASIVVYQRAFSPSHVMQLLGSIWIALAAISFLGLLFPFKFLPILIFQVIYKFLWLIINFAILKKISPLGINILFIIWLLFLVIIIPWKFFFTSILKRN